MKISSFYIILLSLILLSGCKQNAPVVEDWDAYISEHNEWQANRLERLKSEKGWLNLAGLFWLKEGENSFGSDSSNSVVFPEKFPAFGGKILLKDSLVTLLAEKNSGITVDGEPVNELILKNDLSPDVTTMTVESFRWYIVKRGKNYGIRLRDINHPRIAVMDHIPAYEFDKKWVVEADFIPYDSLRTVKVPTVIDDFYEYYKVPGELHFKANGKKQVLLPFKSGNGFFLIIGDATNGMETYGAGRFLSTGPANDDSKVIIDFNRAYNPPCAFSPFATCPLPPKENILQIEITAGEKGVHLE